MNVNHGSVEKCKKYDVIIKTTFLGVGDVAQLVECLPSMQEALDPISNTTSTGCDDTCLGSQFSGVRQEDQKWKDNFIAQQG